MLRKTVDGTLMLTKVPSTTSPSYTVSHDVNLVPINQLADIKLPWKRYVVIGAGKTGLDAILFLIDNKVEHENIVWIVPNDSWFWNRDRLNDLDNLHEATRNNMTCVMEATDVNDVYKRYESEGNFMRLDKNVWPTRMRAATVSSEEMAKFRLLTHVIRKGRIKAIESNAIVFQQGDTIPTDADTLHIDCSTSGTNFPPAKPRIYDGNKINLQLVQLPQACTSGAMVAALELK